MLTVLKIGGNIVDNPEALDLCLRRFAAMPGPKLLVHGGGREATRLSRAMEIPVTMIDGRRVTSAETLEVVTMVYAGLINKRIVSHLQALGCRGALGLCGADAALLPSHRRSPEPVDYGYVGDINPDDIPAERLMRLIDNGIVPVFCAITCQTDDGQLLNSNADSVASALGAACARLTPTRVIFCFEQPGVMRDINDPTSLIASLDPDSFGQLRAEGIIHSGMLPKIEGAIRALRQGVDNVVITNIDGLATDRGTVIRL